MATSQAILQAHHLLPTNQDPFSSAPKTQPGDNKDGHPYQVERIDIPDPEYKSETPEHLQNQDIPGFPSTVAVIGKPGGGKSNLIMNLLTRKVFWLNFFDKVYLLGPTVKADKLFKTIKVPDDQIVDEPETFISKLVEWTEKQKQAVKSDYATAPKCLFYFEDITAYRWNVQNNPEFVKCFTTIRHHKSTAIVAFHKYTALERTARINCMHICIFEVLSSDIQYIYKEYCPPSLNLDDFTEMCIWCWKPDEKSKKPFLYINMYASSDRRFRRCFTDVIDVEHFQGLGALKKQLRKDKVNSLLGKDDKKMSQKRKEMKYENPISETDPTLRKEMGDMTKEPSESAQKKLKEGGAETQDGPFSWGRRSVKDNVFTYLR